MKLPHRLRAIANFIPPNSVVVDIGTDHAILPVYLVRSGLASRVSATDLNAGPLEAARNNVCAAGLSEEISLHLGNGLEPVVCDDIEVVVIAGMGGPNIRQILEDAQLKAAAVKKLIVQPMGGAGSLREWLIENGWSIADEEIVKEDGRFYEIICCQHGLEKETDKNRLLVGPRLLEKRHPLLRELLNLKIEKNRRAVSNMEKSISKVTRARMTGLVEKTEGMERIVKCL